MSTDPGVPDGLRIEQTRVYYDPGSGDVVHVHQLVSPPGEQLDEKRVEDEMKAFEESLRHRHGDAAFIVVEAGDLPTHGESLQVDVEQKRLVPADASR